MWVRIEKPLVILISNPDHNYGGSYAPTCSECTMRLVAMHLMPRDGRRSFCADFIHLPGQAADDVPSAVRYHVSPAKFYPAVFNTTGRDMALGADTVYLPS